MQDNHHERDTPKIATKPEQKEKKQRSISKNSTSCAPTDTIFTNMKSSPSLSITPVNNPALLMLKRDVSKAK